MSTWALFALLGVGTGALYAALAMGLIVAYRGSGVVNFAVGAMAMIPAVVYACLLYTSPSPRDATLSRMPSSA